MSSLRDPLVLVTGAGSGIGRATALAFARERARVLCVDVDGAAAQKTATACEEAGAREGIAYTADVGDAAAMFALADRVHAEHGVVDVLVNNAGVGMSGHFGDMSIDDWEWIRSINLDGVVHGCRAFGPAMVERGSGHVVNVSSGLAYTPRATESAYVATKAAVLAFSQSLRADWQRHGVSVTAVCPGVTNTAIIGGSRFVGDEGRRANAQRLFKRGHSPDKVARAIVQSVRRSKAVVPVGVESKLGRLLHRFGPASLQQAVARQDIGSTASTIARPSGTVLEVPIDDGARLAAYVAGDGPLVVLAHCWTGSAAMWNAVTERLVATGHRVVRYDQRGHGASTLGSQSLSIERIGRDLGSVLEHLDSRDAVVVGHSLGGMAIQSLALQTPDVLRERASAAVLVATTADGLPTRRLGRLATRVIGSAALERAMRTQRGHLFARRALGRAARAEDVMTTRDHFVACAAETRVALLDAMHTMDLTALAQLDVSVTVVHGTRDRLTPLRLGRALAARIGARLVELPDAGHMLPLERPDDVARIVSELARRSPSTADRAVAAARPA